MPNNRLTPFVCIAAPLLSFAVERTITASTGYRFGYEILMLNGVLTFAGLFIGSAHIDKNNLKT